MSDSEAFLSIGAKVNLALAAGLTRRRAVEEVVLSEFPEIDRSSNQFQFLLIAASMAESQYLRRVRPPVPDAGRPRLGNHCPTAPSGTSFDGGSGDRYPGETHCVPVPASRRRLTLMQASPGDYPITLPGGERKRLGDLTRADLDSIVHDRRIRAENAVTRAKGWARLARQVPAGATLGAVLDSLGMNDRGFLTSEMGVNIWTEAA